jgi:dihydrodipicolinate synthase/N-acetylneuraminate lyase
MTYACAMPTLPWLNARPWLIVAAVTPLTDDGAALDLAAIRPYTEFLLANGADGIFACGTTGEGILLTLDERRSVAEAYRDALAGRGRLLIHAGAQTTADTVALAAHARELGADGVAVIPPPYFRLDDASLTAHFLAAAAACAPLAFFIYAFTPRSGYPVPLSVVEAVRTAAPNLVGLKVSESPMSAVEPFLDLGLPLLVGSEPLIPAAMAAGAVGSVSGLAAAHPDAVRAALDQPDAAAEARLTALRTELEGGGRFIASVKASLEDRGIGVSRGVRAPLLPV